MPVASPKCETTMWRHQNDSFGFDLIDFSPNLDEDFDHMKFLDVDQSELMKGGTVFDNATIDLSEFILTAPSSPKYQIRNHDCMWSGTCVDKSHPSKKRGLNLCPASTSSTTATNQPQNNETCCTTMMTTTMQKPSEKCGSLAKTIMMTPNNMKTIIACKKIPAGSSLLINSRINTNTAPTKMNLQIKDSMSIDSSCKDFDQFVNVNLRPDTPLSLGDDVPEFKNNIDLTPCPSGNRVKFNETKNYDQQSMKIINMLVEHLEDPNEASPVGAFGNHRTANDLNDILTDITFLSDYEDMAEDSSAVDIDDDEEMEFKSSKYSKSCGSSSQASSSSSSSSSSRTHGQFEFISDHSYTRPKGSRFDPCTLGVQTPSDSGECLKSF